MAALKSTYRHSRRWWLVGTTVVAAAAFMALFVASSGAILAGSNFEGNDGNLVVNTAGNTDWANVAGRSVGIDTPTGGDDNAFGQGTKEDNANVSVVDGSIPPNKNDLQRFYEASEQAANGHIYLYLGWERLVNIGNANLDFEINKNATAGFTATTTGAITLNRTAGDLLVTYDFGGSGTPTLGLVKWLTAASGATTGDCFSANALPCWGARSTDDALDGANDNRINLTTAGFAEGAVNNGTISEPILGGNLTAGLFGEAAIDLTRAGVFTPGVCEAFGSTFLKSRSSSSFTAELKDFIAPVPVSISNCGSITIHKVTENGDSSFGYTTTGTGLSSFSLSNGGTKPFSPLNAGSYSVTENLTGAQTTAGWTLKSLTCTTTGSGSSSSISGATASITLGNGGTADCTYTNHRNLSPSISTTLSNTSVEVGGTVHDSATLTGASSTASGTVTYTVYTDSACSLGAQAAGIKTVTNGVVPDSNGITFNTAGDYYWQAVYSGDADNNGATSTCTEEHLVVTKKSPTISTTLSGTSVEVGATVHDSSALSGASSDAGGTVTYTVYTNSTCTLGAQAAGTKTVTNGVVPDSNAITFNTAGDYYWQAVYSGDTNNNAATSTCTEEHLVVTKRQPNASTAQHLIPNDTFTLSNGFGTPGGTITFNLYSPSDATCAGAPALTQTVDVNGNGSYDTTNNSFVASAEGTWRWKSTYSGDGNNNPVTSACGTERFTIANS